MQCKIIFFKIHIDIQFISIKMSSCCAGIISILKSAITPIFKLLDIGLYSADVYSDFEFTRFLLVNCQWQYFGFSIGIIGVSYLTTVLFLKKAIRYPENWTKAIFFPIFVIKIFSQKFLSFFSGKFHDNLG